MATLVSVVAAWAVHTHDSTFPCCALTVTVKYIDPLAVARDGTNNFTVTSSVSRQNTSPQALVDTILQSGLIAQITAAILPRFPGGLTALEVAAVTTVTKSVDYP